MLQSQAFFTLFFAALFLGERLRGSNLFGLLVAASGLVLIGLQGGQAMTLAGFALTIAAASMWAKLENVLGDTANPRLMLDASDEVLRSAGLSRQKSGYARSLAGLVAGGELDLAGLPADDEEAIAQLVRIKGIGRWSAEVYLLFAEGRPDIWPAGDLAVMREVGVLLGLPERPDEKRTRELAETWRPHRGAAAIFAWHHYKMVAI